MSRDSRSSIHQRMPDRFEVDHRAALFGARFGGKDPARRAGNTDESNSAAASREVLERQNDAQIDDLEAKVAQMKEITRGIGTEVKASTSMLEGMGVNFDKAGSLMKSTVSNLSVMMKAKGGKNMCKMVAFMVAVFLLLYFMGGRATRPAGTTAVNASFQLKQNASDESVKSR